VEKQIVVEILWRQLLESAVGKRVNVSLYPTLREAIPDKYLVIQEAVRYEQADITFERVRQYIYDYAVYPILVILGGNILCIGISKENVGAIFYYDFDFGLFEIANSLNELIGQLIT
jgi:hypothetical protein